MAISSGDPGNYHVPQLDWLQPPLDPTTHLMRAAIESVSIVSLRGLVSRRRVNSGVMPLFI
jgi:hypothetical protein